MGNGSSRIEEHNFVSCENFEIILNSKEESPRFVHCSSGKSRIVEEELPQVLEEVEEKVTRKLQRLRIEEERLIAEREEERRQEDRLKREKLERERRDNGRTSRQTNREEEERVAVEEELNARERLENEATDKAFQQFQRRHDPTPVLKRSNSVRERLRSFQTQLEEDQRRSGSEGGNDSEESIDLQTKLEEIDSGKQGYDPEKERELHERADKVFKSYQAQQRRSGSLRLKRKPSTKTARIVRSLTFEEEYTNAQQRVSVRRRNEQRRHSTDRTNNAAPVDSCENSDEAEDAVDGGVVRINEGHVKRRLDLYKKSAEIVEDHQSIALQKKTSAETRNRETASAPMPERVDGLEELNTDERDAFLLYLDEDRKSREFKAKMTSLRLANQMDEALEQEEGYHATAVAISRCKRRLLRFGIELNTVRNQDGETIKLMRQSKIIADVSAHTPLEGQGKETIPDGNVGGKIKNFQH